MKRFLPILFFCIYQILSAQTYPIVDTDVTDFYDDVSLISAPLSGSAFFGQDAHYTGNLPTYIDNGDGTITDSITGLMWQKDMGTKISYAEAVNKADTLTLGGHSDWRVPTLKELYSLILFSGRVMGENAMEMFIDTDYFIQPLGDTTLGEREIDAQTWSSTHYTGLTMGGDSTLFGVNFVDGRIKGYPKYEPPMGTVPMEMYFRMVRGNPDYGINSFVDNGDGTITDQATGLMWQQADDGTLRDWEDALSYAESLTLAGQTDWRLPNAKELHSIVDYSRSPQATSSAAIDPIFSTTEINDPDGNPGQYPYFWTSSPHLDGVNPYSTAVYIAFGEAQGEMTGILVDVHGTGSQRSDPKSGNPSDYPDFFGPQGDVRYVFNAVRCVRNVSGTNSRSDLKGSLPFKVQIFPNPTKDLATIAFETNQGDVSVTITDQLGRTVRFSQYKNQKEIDIDMKMLNPGVYFVNIFTTQGLVSQKLIRW